MSNDNISLHKWPIRNIKDAMCSKVINVMIFFLLEEELLVKFIP